VPKFSPASSGGYKLLQLVVEKAIRIFQTSQHFERANPACGCQPEIETEIVTQKSVISAIISLTHIRDGISQLNLWSRVLLQELTVAQLVKKFPTFHETRNLITM
jgi:hypothetical protein